MRRDMKSELAEVADAIRARGATALYLYGSSARGEAGPSSDVDLFIDYDEQGRFNAFDLVYTMTGGGPGGATTTLVMAVYKAGFRDFRMGYASAIAMVLFAIILVVSLVQLRYFQDRKSA